MPPLIAYVAFFWRRRADLLVRRGAGRCVGLGYLGSTGALHEIGAMVWGEAEMIEQGR